MLALKDWQQAQGLRLTSALIVSIQLDLAASQSLDTKAKPLVVVVSKIFNSSNLEKKEESAESASTRTERHAHLLVNDDGQLSNSADS